MRRLGMCSVRFPDNLIDGTAMRRLIFSLGLVAGLIGLDAVSVRAADVAAAVKVIRAVENEGRGNKEATAAWRELAKSPASDLPAILAGFDGANPLAVNYLRSAA